MSAWDTLFTSNIVHFPMVGIGGTLRSWDITHPVSKWPDILVGAFKNGLLDDVNGGGKQIVNLLALQPSDLTHGVRAINSGTSHKTAMSVENAQPGSYGGTFGFRATDTVATVYTAGRMYGVFDGATFAQARLTIQTATANEVFLDVLTLKGTSVGIGTLNPTAPLHVVGLVTYASDAAAGTGGLTAGALYKDAAGGVHVKL